jgi:anti-anti-sigma regulatory factor
MLTGEVTGREPAGAAPERTGLSVTELPGDDETRVRVDGVIDAETAPGLRHELLRRSRGGTVPLDVDLSGVTQLVSAGVSVLHRVVEKHAEQGAKLTLRALPGTPAEHVLTLVALPHVTEPLN